MWFKNLRVYRIKKWEISADMLADKLAKHVLSQLNSSEMQTKGWITPKISTSNLIHKSGQQTLIALGYERKLLPNSVINQYAKIRAQEFEDRQGFRPSRKQVKEIKELVTQELLPRAFSLTSKLFAWVDPVNGWFVIDTSSTSKADEFIQTLHKSFEDFELKKLNTKISAKVAMTNWVKVGEPPVGFSIDKDCELRGTNDEKSIVRYLRYSLDAQEIKSHLSTGSEIVKLGMTWQNKISFVLDENLQIKKIAPLDILYENTESDEDLFDSDFAIMSNELGKLITDLIETLEGEV